MEQIDRKSQKLCRAVAIYGDNCIDRYTAPICGDYIGGNAVNVAVHLVAQGADVAFFGATGNDVEGELVRDALISRGVDCTGLEVRPGQTAVTWIEVRTGERIVLGDRIGVQCPLSLSGEALQKIARYPVVHCAAFTAWSVRPDDAQPHLASEIRYLAQQGAFVSVDFSELEEPELANSAGSHIGVAFSSRGPRCSDASIERVAEFFRASGIREVVITLGPAGACSIADGKSFRISAVPANVVDTLGAGDAFIAAWLYGWLIGDGPRERLHRAAEIAGRTCEYFGAWPQTSP
jgi:fructoselysine 6-kinase